MILHKKGDILWTSVGDTPVQCEVVSSVEKDGKVLYGIVNLKGAKFNFRLPRGNETLFASKQEVINALNRYYEQIN